MKKVVCIVGPTACGKTTLSIELAKKYNGEIISADSMQIYKGHPIASAVPTKKEMQGIPHYLLEQLSNNQSFSVADFCSKANQIIDDIINRGKLPFIVGGTGLYIDALVNNFNFLPCEDASAIREKYCRLYDELGGEQLLKMLSLIDKDTATALHPNDKKRIVRAMEFYEISGEKRHGEAQNGKKTLDALYIGINFANRAILYDRINTRVDAMLNSGLLHEARLSYINGNVGGAKQAIGHKELYPYFSGEKTLEEATESLKTKTRNYAKRQMTWFRRNININWVYPDTENNYIDKACEFINEWKKQQI